MAILLNTILFAYKSYPCIVVVQMPVVFLFDMFMKNKLLNT